MKPASKHSKEEQKEIKLLRAKLYHLIHRHDFEYKEKKVAITMARDKAGQVGEGAEEFLRKRRETGARCMRNYRARQKLLKEAQNGTLS